MHGSIKIAADGWQLDFRGLQAHWWVYANQLANFQGPVDFSSNVSIQSKRAVHCRQCVREERTPLVVHVCHSVGNN